MNIIERLIFRQQIWSIAASLVLKTCIIFNKDLNIQDSFLKMALSECSTYAWNFAKKRTKLQNLFRKLPEIFSSNYFWENFRGTDLIKLTLLSMLLIERLTFLEMPLELSIDNEPQIYESY